MSARPARPGPRTGRRRWAQAEAAVLGSTWARLLGAAVLALVVAAWQPPRMLPESLEMLSTGRCMLGLHSAAPPCADLAGTFWSPLFPLLAGALSVLLPLPVAGGLVALAAWVGLVLGAGALGQRLTDDRGAWAAALLVGLTPGVAAYAMLADSRGLGLALGAWAAALAVDGARPAASPWRAAGAGLLAGLAALARPEHVVLVGAVTLLSATGGLRPAARTLGAALLPLLPSWLALSWASGRPTLLPRSGQAIGLALVSVIPERWARQLVGEGAWLLPLRRAVAAGPWPADVGATLHPQPLAGLVWLADQATDLVPAWIWLLALAGLVLALVDRRGRAALALLALATPGVAAVASSRGRVALLPLASLLPVVVAALVLGAAALARLAGRAAERLPSPAGPPLALASLGLVAGLLALTGPRLDFPDTPENADSGRAAASALALALPPGSPVVASFEASPLVHMAGMRWVPWPSPWEPWRWPDPQTGPAMAILTPADGDWLPAPPWVPAGLHLRPVGAYGTDGTAVVLLSVEPARP